ncbi:hypothetical protein DL240_13430 [Lujinxingia litoralis]|uniref:HTH tetR-type domain-containing protein n=1 Tax=Lujinxingia litoralis TaxID=2211119 RepID=A0A328C4V8_9DELT|nr:TetR/AcrR family transcriptional regulator [Lujinxingia litoralis]RAL21130.1 hypothetical protein DL240_13430 [Lujinxingia litoralis]
MSEHPRQRLGHDEACERILDAAAHVFNQRGRAMTVEEIATRAGYSTSALYKHFANRDDIFCSLWRRVRARFSEVLHQPLPERLPFKERLRWLLHNLADFAEEERELYLAGIVNAPMSPAAGQIDDEIRALYATHQQVLRALMAEGIAEGALRPGDPLDYALALGGTLHSLTLHWAFEGPFALKPAIDRALDLFLQGAGAR